MVEGEPSNGGRAMRASASTSVGLSAEIEDFLLTIRKQNAIVTLASQQPEHLLHGTFGPTLVGQCQTLAFALVGGDRDGCRRRQPGEELGSPARMVGHSPGVSMARLEAGKVHVDGRDV